MEKVKVAQIGIGHDHGRPTFESLKRPDSPFEVMGYYVSEREKELFPQYMYVFEGCRELTLDEILSNNEIKAVTIESEEVNLTEYALAAAEQGKHIHMDKPGGISFEEFEKLIATVKKNGTVFHVGYMYRYNPYVIELFEKIKKGDLGEIFSVEAQMDCRHPVEKRQWLKTFPGGMMFFLGCHLIDLILRIQGAPEKIIPLNCSTGFDGVTSDDFGMAALVYPHGVSFAKTCAEEMGGFARRHLVVNGSKATVELRPLEVLAPNDMIFTEKTVYTEQDWANRGEFQKTPLFNRYNAMMDAFGEMVQGVRENPYSYDYELMVYRTVLQCCGVSL